MKNTVYARAAETEALTPEAFGVELARFFLDRNPQVTRVDLDLLEQPWQRLAPGGIEHDHAFVAAGGGARAARIQADRGTCLALGGLTDLLVMKTTRSAFAGFPRDEYTTLPETTDRIFRTIVSAEWRWKGLDPATFDRFERVRQILLDTFAGHDSLSVQQTLHAMGKAVLEQVDGVDEIRLSLPNRHCLAFDLTRFGLKNRNEIFVVTDEPYGLIEATLSRDS
jgi:urate oxidase